jgi:hypothetical protein
VNDTNRHDPDSLAGRLKASLETAASRHDKPALPADAIIVPWDQAPLNFQFFNTEGKLLLEVKELPDGKLDVIGDPELYTEQGKRFLETLVELGLSTNWMRPYRKPEPSSQ